MDKAIKKKLDVLCSSVYCQLCSVNINSVSVERSHYSCKRHLDKVAAYKSKWTAKQYSKAKNSVNSAAQVSNNHFEIPRVLNSPVLLHCRVCKTSFSTAFDLKVHTQTFPHVQLAKLKSDLIRLGIKKEFWTIQEGDLIFVSCTPCQAQLQSGCDMESHFQSQRHIDSYNYWCSTQPVRKNIPESYMRWFYCNICDFDLNGTSNAEQHYTFPKHIRNFSDKCSNSNAKTMQSKENKPCGVVTAQNNREVIEYLHNDEATTSKTLKSLSVSDAKSDVNHQSKRSCLPVVASNQYQDFLTKNCETQNNTESDNSPISFPTVFRTEEVETNTDDLSEERSHLKKQVFNELGHLIQKLYYSKTVPYEVSLDYLKRINKEVDEIVKNCDAKQEVEDRTPVIEAKSKTDTVEPNIYSDFNDNQINNNLDESVCKEEGKEAAKVNCKEDDLVLPKMSLAFTHSTAQTSFERLSTVSVNSLNENSSFEENPSSNAICGQIADISSMLDDIGQRKLNILLGGSEEGLLEIELLNEIEILLKQIDKGDIPLEETLECLEKYNKELDEAVSNNEDIEVCHEELSVGLSNGEESGSHPIADGETSEVGEIQIQDLDVTVDWKKVNEGATSQTDESVKRKTESERKKTSAAQPQPDLSLEPSELYESRLSLSFYNYYSGNNFQQYVDFRDIYLNGSIEELKNWNAVRNCNSLLNANVAVQDTLETTCDPSEINLLIELGSEEASASQTEPDLPMEPSELNECRLSLSFYNYYAGNNLHKFMDFCSVFLNGSMGAFQNWNALHAE